MKNTNFRKENRKDLSINDKLSLSLNTKVKVKVKVMFSYEQNI